MAHHVILGAGPAGVIAAETLRKQAPADRITLVGDEPEPPYSRMAIPYLLMGNIQEEGTWLRKTATHWADRRIERARLVDADGADLVVVVVRGEGALRRGDPQGRQEPLPVAPPGRGLLTVGWVELCEAHVRSSPWASQSLDPPYGFATCSSRAEESTIMALSPPVSAINEDSAPSRAASDRNSSKKCLYPA